MTDERLQEIAAMSGFSVEQVRECCDTECTVTQSLWLETASPREIAVWLVSNLERLTRLDPRQKLPTQSA